MTFERYAAIDWSGAKGSKHKGIAVAIAEGDAPPRLVRADHVWSRRDVLDWLLATAKEGATLFGFDFSFAPPWLERGAYLPGEKAPERAKPFWAYIDANSEDEDLGAASFLEARRGKHFYFGKADGEKAPFMHFRQVEQRYNATGGGKTASIYDAIGAAQVAKASFAGMRLLHQLDGHLPIWPFDAVQWGSSAVVEIYGRLYIRMAGGSGNKLRTVSDLNAALESLGSQPFADDRPLSDHETDALVTAAGMRAHAANPVAFDPPDLTDEIARTEGWTFGVV